MFGTVLSGVLVPGDVSAVDVDHKEGETAYYHAGGAEIVA